jgi:hypothetical protein
MPDLNLIPIWKPNSQLHYKIWRKETFNFKEAKSDAFEIVYDVKLKLLNDGTIEAYYPNNLLSTIKSLKALEAYYSNLDFPLQNTLYYKVDENFQFDSLLDVDSIMKHITFIKDALQDKLGKEEFELLDEELAFFEGSGGFVKKHFSKDLITIHDFYGTPVYDGHFFDLVENDSSKKSIRKKLLSLIKLDLGKIDILQADFIDDDLYQIELLRGTDTVSTKTRQNFEEIKTIFIDHQFNMEDFDDITLHHQKFIYNNKDWILSQYHYHFKIQTPQMNKEMQCKMERIK